MSDVAQEAGVSVTTVSHVLNHTATISEVTQERVHLAIEKLGYQPALRHIVPNSSSRVIGVMAPEMTNEFYSRSIQSICNEGWKNDYTVLVCGMRHNHDAELRHIKTLISKNISGLIFLGGFLEQKYIMDAAEYIPVVLGDRYFLNHAVPSVITDNIGVMRRLVSKLASAGYTKIGYISEDFQMNNVSDRYMGFKTGIEENGLKFNESFVSIDKKLRLNKTTNAYNFMSEWIKSGKQIPEVFVCSSDLVAIGIMSALRKEEFRVPEDVGIVGFDDCAFAAHAYPPLTTIAQNMTLLGKTCFNTLIKSINETSHAGNQTVLKAKIVVRESVKL